MKNLPLIEFNPKLPKLSKNEKDVLKLLVEAGRLIAPLYAEQEKEAENGVSRGEIDKEGKKNASILSPYTVVKKENGKLIATPYHIYYKKFLDPIVEKLNHASNISQNREFAKFLSLQAKALLDGSYDDSTAAWLKMKPYIVDISIGPMEHYDTDFFFAKAAYRGWVGIIDKDSTKKLEYYKTVTLSARRKAIGSGERVENHERVKGKVINEVLVSGLMARTKFVGMILPMTLRLVEKYGSDVTVFNQTNDLRIKEQIIPVFNKIFSPGFRQGFEVEDLRAGSLRYVMLHELAHNYLYYKNAKNLGSLLPVIYELSATVLGMKIAGTLLIKDIITNKQLESMIIAFICRSFDLIKKSKENKSTINYALGGSIFINFMLKNEALRQYQGLAIPNFMKIFVSLHELSLILEMLLSSGSRKDAEDFIKKYGQ